ncbi:hypothetical protein ACKLNR_006309 [Fusarium oxysporum f. sp. zingiberi]
MIKDAAQQQTEWSEKVKALELEKSTLLATMTQKDEGFRAEISRFSDQQTEWSDKAKTLEQEKSSLLGIVSEKDKALAIQSEKIRALEVQLNAIDDIQQEIAPSTEELVQPHIRLPEMVEEWSEGELDVDARVHASQLGSRRTRNRVAEAFSSSHLGLQRLGQRNY